MKFKNGSNGGSEITKPSQDIEMGTHIIKAAMFISIFPVVIYLSTASNYKFLGVYEQLLLTN